MTSCSRLCLLSALWIGPAALGAAPTQVGDRWTFGNDTLQVSVSTTSASFEVRDRRCGQLWRQASSPAGEQWVVPVPRVTAPLALDGQLADWPAGEALTPTADQVTAGVTPGGPADLAATGRLAWDAAGCWLAAAVRDEALVPVAPDTNLWDVDSVELWLGQEHWGFAPRGAAVEIVCWSTAARAADCRAAWRATADGWTLEAFVPWAQITANGQPPRVGEELLLAWGVNDADGRTGRQVQSFYPAGYRHKVFGTHAVARWSTTAGPAKRETWAPRDVVVKAVRPLAAPAEGVELDLDYGREGGPPKPVTLRVSLQPGAGDLACEVAGEPDLKFQELALPAPFILDTADARLVIPHQAGLLFGVRELAYHGRSLGGMYSMPWFGAADLTGGQGYLGILETPDDATFRGAKVATETGEVLAVQPVFRPQQGRFGYARRVLYHFADRGGYVALAKRYRAYARQTGLLKTLAEKRVERPAIDRLVGAVNIYAGGDFGNVTELRQMGVERALISGFGGSQVRQMNDWGYLTTRYDIYTDLYEPGTPPSKWERCEGFTFPDDVIKTADGQNQIGWCPVPNPTTGKPDPSYVICWTCGLRTLREKMPKRLAERPLGAYFLDCVTSAGLYECFDPRHPLTRTADREARVAQFAHLSKDLGLVAGSEAGRDWAAPVADYFEGIMSTATWFAAPQELHGLPFEAIESNPRYDEYALNPARRVPLFQLVYGDCVETTWWWGDNSHRMYSAWAQKDLLQLVHASMPMWVLWQAQQGLFLGNLDRFKACYDSVGRWRRAVGYSEMTGHERLTPDGLVQRSSFANGATVTVNFATEPRTAGGVTLPARSYRFDGEAAREAGLPVGQPQRAQDDWRPRELVRTPNTGFETRPLFWSASEGMSLEVQSEVVHGGAKAARVRGTQLKGFSYASSVRVPVEPGRKYTVRGWLRVDALDPPAFAPCFKCGLNAGDQHLTNVFTPFYDVTKMGTWQRLEATFTAPAKATTGYLALEKHTTATVTADLYVDDLELVAD